MVLEVCIIWIYKHILSSICIVNKTCTWSKRLPHCRGSPFYLPILSQVPFYDPWWSNPYFTWIFEASHKWLLCISESKDICRWYMLISTHQSFSWVDFGIQQARVRLSPCVTQCSQASCLWKTDNYAPWTKATVHPKVWDWMLRRVVLCQHDEIQEALVRKECESKPQLRAIKQPHHPTKVTKASHIKIIQHRGWVIGCLKEVHFDVQVGEGHQGPNA